GRTARGRRVVDVVQSSWASANARTPSITFEMRPSGPNTYCWLTNGKTTSREATYNPIKPSAARSHAQTIGREARMIVKPPRNSSGARTMKNATMIDSTCSPMATMYHAAPPSTFAEMDRSPLPHLLFALPAAHPLLAPLPAHLSALLPSPRRAFHRVAGRRVTPCRISSFPSPFPEGTWCRHVGEQIYRGARAPKNPATATSLGYEVAYRTFPGPP